MPVLGTLTPKCKQQRIELNINEGMCLVVLILLIPLYSTAECSIWLFYNKIFLKKLKSKPLPGSFNFMGKDLH